MASILLASVGSAIGAGFGGTILGLTGATIGGAIGTFAGTMIDSWIATSLAPGQHNEGQRLDSLTITTSTEGAVIPRIYGRMRIGGNIIWATDFTETVNTTTQGGGKGGGPKVTTTAYLYSASFAVALCEGPISGIGRIWADGKPLDLSNVTWRIYTGDEAQLPDPFIEAKMGTGNAPAYRGTAYVMFEELPLEQFGNRIPQLSFEVFRPVIAPDTAEGMIRAVTLIPGTGEFVYATEPVSRGTGGSTSSENVHTTNAVPDIVAALDQLQAAAPNIESISLVVSWFGTDLRAGNCQFMPGVESTTKVTTPKSWAVNGVARSVAHVVSASTGGTPAYGGTPADFAVVQAIKEIKARGLRVTLYPFLLMDIPAGNTLPDPYSDNAATIGQAVYPWRGRITCSPAAGYAGTVDKTASAATQVSAFFGNAQVSDFAVSGETVSWAGGADWGYRRMILHYAHLCVAAGGVDAFLIGSEMRGLTTIRDSAQNYPAVTELAQLADDVSTLLNTITTTEVVTNDFSTMVTGAYPGDTPAGVFEATTSVWQTWANPAPTVTPGSIDTSSSNNSILFRNFDVTQLVSAADIDAGLVSLHFSGSQTRIWGGPRLQLRAYGLADASGVPDITFPHQFPPAILDVQSLTSVATPSAVTSGDGVLPAGTRWIQLQVILYDGLSASGFDIHLTVSKTRSWSGEVSYAADWSEYFGHHPSDGTGDVFFHLDPLWASSAIDFIGIDNYLPLSDWRDGFDHTDAQAGWNSIRDIDYLRSNIEGGEGFEWFYASDADRTAQVRTPITDGAYNKSWVFRPKDMRSWWSNQHYDRPGGVESTAPTSWVPQSKPIRFTELGCPAVDRGTNQPNVFYDPKSDESALPYFSREWQDEAIPRRYLEAMLGYWADLGNNPTSNVYAAKMIDMGEAAVWTWDARPYPDFPARVNIWADAPNWRLGHWLNGRLGAVGLGALVRELCLRAGLAGNMIDVKELSETVPGFAISSLESPRASISTLARHFGFDAVESGGVIRFVTRGQRATSVIAPDNMVAGTGDVMELTRGQETELPQSLKWQIVRHDEEYDAATVEARRVTVEAARVASESFPLAVSLEEADRRCRRALMEAWVGRETMTAKFPPSRLMLDPGDVVSLDNDGRRIDYRITNIDDAGARTIKAIRTDPAIYDLPPGQYRPANLPGATVYGPAEVAMMNLPQLDEDVPAHQPYSAVFAKPWYGTAAVWRSADTSGFALIDTIRRAAQIGTLAADLPASHINRFDNGTEILVDVSSGSLTSVTDIDLFAGANALAVESAPGIWEVIQFGNAELVAVGRYRLTRLLRGQRGTGDAIGNPAPTGARVVILGSSLMPLSIAEADLGLPWNWRIGPASAAPSDAIMQEKSFTPNGRGLIPFAPAQLRMRREVSGNLSLRWMRCDRAFSADSWVLTEVPMSEAAEAYDLEFLDGATVKRSLQVATPVFTYTAAMQAADFGGPVSSLSIRLYQIGALGRGVPLAKTLTIKESL